MFRIVMENRGGEMDSRYAKDGEDAAKVLAQMLHDCPELADGDTFRIYDEDEE